MLFHLLSGLWWHTVLGPPLPCATAGSQCSPIEHEKHFRLLAQHGEEEASYKQSASFILLSQDVRCPKLMQCSAAG